MLQTASVSVRSPTSKNGQSVRVRVLLDGGAQRTFITRSLAEDLSLPLQTGEQLSVATFGTSDPTITSSATCEFSLILKDGTSFPISGNVLPKLTHPIRRGAVPAKDMAVLRSMSPSCFADSIPTEPDSEIGIDILIGADYLWSLMSNEERVSLPSGLFLMHSRLGYVLSGSCFADHNLRPHLSNVCHAFFAAQAETYQFLTCGHSTRAQALITLFATITFSSCPKPIPPSSSLHHYRKRGSASYYRKRGSASYYRKRGSASYIVREVLSVRERDTEREIERERRKWRHHCRAKIGDEFTLSLAKNSHNWQWAYTFNFPCQKFALFVSPFTPPVSPFTERSLLWRWNSQWAHTFHCQKFFRPLCSPSFKRHEPRRVIENPRQLIKSCPAPFCSSHRKNESN